MACRDPSHRRKANPASPREASMIRLRARAAEIPEDTLVLRDAIKRELWLRGLTIADVAAKMRQNNEYVRRLLSLSGAYRHKPTIIHPNQLARLCDAAGIEGELRARWNMLGAIAMGWQIDLTSDLTPLEREDRYNRLRAVGCLCCLLNERCGLQATPLAPLWDRLGNRIEIHHLNEGGVHGGKRLGDAFTVPICTWHHRGIIPVRRDGARLSQDEATALYGPSWAHGSKPFRLVYTTDEELLAMANALMGPPTDQERAF